MVFVFFWLPDMPVGPVVLAVWASEMWQQWNGGDGEACFGMDS